MAVLLGFTVAFIGAPVGISGAFLLLPLQIHLLGVVTPAASSTNLVFNLMATPAGVIRYRRQGQLHRRVVLPIVLGSVPGVVVGAWLRVTVFAPPERFRVIVAVVLVGLAARILWSLRTAPATEVVGEPVLVVPRRAVFGVALLVGLVGGIYGVGGASLLVPFLVGVLGIPLRYVVGATLLGTFLTSGAGVASFTVLAGTAYPQALPDWEFGLSAGLGGLLGSYLGARLHPHVPERGAKVGLVGVVVALAVLTVT